LQLAAVSVMLWMRVLSVREWVKSGATVQDPSSTLPLLSTRNCDADKGQQQLQLAKSPSIYRPAT